MPVISLTPLTVSLGSVESQFTVDNVIPIEYSLIPVRVANITGYSVKVNINATGQVQVDMSSYVDERITSCGVEFYEV